MTSPSPRAARPWIGHAYRGHVWKVPVAKDETHPREEPARRIGVS